MKIIIMNNPDLELSIEEVDLSELPIWEATSKGVLISTTPDPGSEPDVCPGCGWEGPAGYLTPNGLCDLCMDDIEGCNDQDD